MKNSFFFYFIKFSISLKFRYSIGWIKLLSTLSRHKDIRVSAPAQKALCNFDTDDPIQKDVNVYSSRVFPLHPTSRTLLNPKLDVIFIHGLLGGVFITWRQRDFGHCTHKSPLELLGERVTVKIIRGL